MRKSRGFTLIELLVVIAIIALLLSILMPSLSRVRKQAKEVACQSKLRQWGVIFSMYMDDNDGFFPISLRGKVYEYWMSQLRPYYQDPQIRCCPMATKPRLNLDGSHGPGWGKGVFQAWGILDSRYGKNEGDYGSYGMNEWLDDPPVNWGNAEPHPAKNFWKHSSVVRHASDIPIFLDCMAATKFPDHDNVPPAWDGDLTWNFGEDEMNFFCINRHDGAINGLFGDWSVRRIGLKELWTLKWNREYDTCGSWTKCGGVEPGDWPEWMRGFRDY
ncbi:MAG: type II secretion system protein [Planctomycetota bacterium]